MNIPLPLRIRRTMVAGLRAGRARHSVRAVRCQFQPGARGATRPTSASSFNRSSPGVGISLRVVPRPFVVVFREP